MNGPLTALVKGEGWGNKTEERFKKCLALKRGGLFEKGAYRGLWCVYANVTQSLQFSYFLF